MVFVASRCNILATHSVTLAGRPPSLFNFSRISSTRVAGASGFTRISSACSRIASIASFKAGYPVNTSDGLRIRVTHRTDHGETVAGSGHVQIAEQHIENFLVDQSKGLADPGGGSDVESTGS